MEETERGFKLPPSPFGVEYRTLAGEPHYPECSPSRSKPGAGDKVPNPGHRIRITKRQHERLIRSLKSPEELAKHYKISVESVKRYIREARKENNEPTT